MSSLFEGYTSAVIPTHDVLSVNNGSFKTAGIMIATSIIEGGPAPQCFARPVADIFVYNEIYSDVGMQEINDFESEKMKKVSVYAEITFFLITGIFSN